MFFRFERSIRALVRLFGLLPAALLRFIYRLSEPFSGMFFVLIRYVTLANLCRSFGTNVYVGSDVEIRFAENLSVGSNVSIHRSCYIDALGDIDIGSNVSIAHQTSLVALEHGWDDTSVPIRDNPIIAMPIRIDSDVWIGAGVRILGGAHVAGRSVVAAGAVYTAKTEPIEGHLYAGIPATRKKSLPMPDEEAADRFRSPDGHRSLPKTIVKSVQ